MLRPGLYPDQGFEAYPDLRAQSVTPSGVYTHYPPGPEYLLYVAMRLLGPHPISRLRILPLAISWGAAVFFGLSLRRRFGTPVAGLVMLACAALPMFSDADSFLHYDGYAFALLLVEIGICVGRNEPRPASGASFGTVVGMILPLLLLGFLQGWLSFDYVFLVTLVPAATELATGRLGVDHTACLRPALWRCMAAGGGFALAHLLHFIEVWAFFGSFHAAARDLGDAAAFRSGAAGSLHRLAMTFAILKYYLVGQYPISTFFWRPDAGIPGNWRVFRFAGLTVGIWWIVLTHVFIVGRLLRQRRARSAGPGRPIDNDWLAVSLYGLVPCVLWYIVMLDHALEHTHFLYRHLFFGFFLGTLFCATALVKLLEPVRLRALFVFPRPLALISGTLKKNGP
ncbi:MAG TPA: hypothetical protein VND19_09770 [Acetobacteraceae bacterium]|nr:hypothetical protein [Acetobacteraceae bacterium]